MQIHRTTLILQLACQFGSHEPSPFEARWSESGNSKDECYPRQLFMPSEPKPVDYGWCESPAMVAIKNVTGQNLSVNPTKEAMDELNKAVIYVGTLDKPMLIPIRPFGQPALIPIGDEPLYWHAPVAAEAKILVVPRCKAE